MKGGARQAANLAAARRRMPHYQSPTRDDVQYADDSERMAHLVCGDYCTSCGVIVDEAGLHASDCVDVSRERRRSA